MEFGIALGVFLLSHRIPAWLGVKAKLEQVLGARGYTVFFSVLSVALLVWVIGAASRAPAVQIWPQTQAARWGVNMVMPVVVVLAVFGIGAPNPFAFEGRADGFDPNRPGIAGVTRQPLLWALLLWSVAHLIANGDLAHVILFSVFAAFSGLGMLIVERRRRHLWGEQVWNERARQTRLVPFAALLRGIWQPSGPPSLHRLGLAFVIWAILFSAHEFLIGVTPVP